MNDEKKHRSHLPMPTPTRTGPITYDAKDPDTKFPPIEQLRPPKGAPNVLIILIDDAGFGSASAFGGPCQTPNALLEPNPASSIRMISTFGAPSGGRTGVIGGNFVSGSLAS